MESIRATTQKLINNLSYSKQKEDILKQGLRRVFSNKERRHIKNHSFNNRRIVLNVDSSVWLYLLNLKKEQLLKNINQTLKPTEAITEIHLRLDRNGT
jgi:hypothetical protein